jgi:hypothetical protein
VDWRPSGQKTAGGCGVPRFCESFKTALDIPLLITRYPDCRRIENCRPALFVFHRRGRVAARSFNMDLNFLGGILKMKDLKNGMALLLAAAMLILAGCPMGQDEDTKNEAAIVTGITVAGVAVTEIPAPVPQSVWGGAGFDMLTVEDDQLGQAVIGQLGNAQIVVAASAGAKVKYAVTSFDRPENFQDGNVITLINNGYLCIQVTSEDGKTVNYYVLEVRTGNTLVALTGITVAGVEAALGTPNVAWNQALAGSVTLTGAAGNNAQVTVSAIPDANQTVKYAKVTGPGQPVFGDTKAFTFADGDFLYIEVTAENGINKTVYKIEVWVGRNTALSALSIGEVSISDYGTPAADLSEAIPGTGIFNAIEETPYTIAVTPADPDASASWAAANTDTAEPVFGTGPTVTIVNGGYLYVKVVAANGTTTAYHKIRVRTAGLVEKIVAGASSVPVYRFTPPEGSQWGDYKAMTFTVMVADEESYTHPAGRAHIVGNYPASNFTAGGIWTSSDWGSERLVNISGGAANDTLKSILDDPGLYVWKRLEYPIDDPPSGSGYNAEDYYPAEDAPGPFYFGLGLTLNPNNTTGTVTYYIKDVALVTENGETLSADALDTVFEGEITLGQLWCKFNVDTGTVVRTLEQEPVAE